MDFLLIIFLIFLVGNMAGFLGAIIGGGGLVSIPFLMFLGLPPQIAIATNKLGSIGFSLGAISKFWKERKIVWKFVLCFSLLGTGGAYFGANLLLNIDQQSLSKIISLILLLFLPFIFIKKSFGIKRKNTSKIKRIIGYSLYFLAMVYGGFFGGGAGFLIIYIVVFFFGLKIIEANATDSIPWLIQSIVSLIIFALNGLINYRYGMVLFLGMLSGSYFGAHIAIRKGDAWVKIVFAGIIIFSAIKILFLS